MIRLELGARLFIISFSPWLGLCSLLATCHGYSHWRKHQICFWTAESVFSPKATGDIFGPDCDALRASVMS